MSGSGSIKNCAWLDRAVVKPWRADHLELHAAAYTFQNADDLLIEPHLKGLGHVFIGERDVGGNITMSGVLQLMRNGGVAPAAAITKQDAGVRWRMDGHEVRKPRHSGVGDERGLQD